MKQKKALFIIFLFITFTGKSGLFPDSYSFRHITIQNGLSHTDANSIVKDKKGYVWIGTYSGLDRYDGFRIKSFYNEIDYVNRPYLNRIADISIGEDGLLWLATHAGIQLFDPIHEQFLPVEIKNQDQRRDKIDLKKIITLNNAYVFTLDKYQQVSMYDVSKNEGGYLLTKAPFSLNANCYSFFFDKNNQIWFSTDQGIWKLPSDNNLIYYNVPEISDEVFFTYLDDNRLLVSNEEKLIIYEDFNPSTEHSQSVDLTNGQVVYLSKDYGKITDIKSSCPDEYWISTLKGLFFVTKTEGKFTSKAIYAKDYLSGLSSDLINQLFIDENKHLFIATYAGGINIIDLKRKPFYSIQFTPCIENPIPEKIVRSIVRDGDYLWIGSNTMGISHVHTKNVAHTFFQVSNSGLRSDEIRSMLIDKEDYLWIGHVKGIDIINRDRDRNVSFLSKQDAPSFPEIEVSSLVIDCFNQIWVGTWHDGICRIRKKENGVYETVFFKQAQPDSEAFSSSRIITIYAPEEKPELYFSTGEQLVRLFMDENGDVVNSFIYEGNNKKEHSLSSNFICSIREKNDSTLWLGSIGGGLSEIHMFPDGNYQAFNYSEENGLHIKDVECIEKDDSGNIWLGGNELVKYNQKTNSFKSYLVGKNCYKVGASFKDKEGILYFGGIDGLIYFNPDEIRENPTAAIPEISSLRINNVYPIIAPANDFVLPQGIAYSDKIKLKYNQNNLSFDFFISNYANPTGCEFQYRLRGYETGFNNITGDIPSAYYANLKPGKYELELLAINDDGLLNQNKRSLGIVITPPWWFSIGAKIGYVVLGILTLFVIFFYFHKWISLREQLEIQDLKEKQKEKMHQMQLQFFTNISHEFRTPLTLISGVTEKLQQENHGLRRCHQLDVLLSNVKRMSLLVNELMDFRKAETGHFNLSVENRDINEFVKDICGDFNDLAKKKDILFDVQIGKSLYNIWFDPQITEKIIMNLLNNAFKYTKEGGYVQVSILSDLSNHITPFENYYKIQSDFNAKSYVYICIKDTGIGISKRSIAKVFDRFYQVEDSEYDPHLGSGIGLALVKSLILLHKGELTIFSERNKGSEFITAIPVDKEDYTELETRKTNRYIANKNERYILEHNYSSKRGEFIKKNGKNQKLKILLVEDNDEIRKFIADSFSEEFEIYEAVHGIDALKKLEENIPDIIISDVIMPLMDGFELCKKIKNDPDLCAIPFIMLTAKNSTDDTITGIESGADAYIGKPMSIKLLTATVRNLLHQKKRIKNVLSNDYLSKAINDTMKVKDRQFYEQLIQVIEKNLANTSLDVDLFSKELNYSRTKLYQKVSNVTGKPVMDFVRSIRLRKATQYMAEEDITIQEIMERIGIQSQSNFSSSFKKEFGKTPSQFIADLKNNTEGKKPKRHKAD